MPAVDQLRASSSCRCRADAILKTQLMRPLKAVLLCAATFLSGCTSSVVLTAAGPNKDVNSGMFATFATAVDEGFRRPTTQNGYAILEHGLALVDVNCMDFFRSEGRLQTTLNVIRDTTALVGSLAAGAIAALHASQDAAAIVSLTVAGIAGGVTVANANFLFGSDNIDSVHELTVKALATHTDAAMELATAHPEKVTVPWALRQVAAHQVLCQPAHILSLTRSAIRHGTVEPYNPAGGPIAPAGQPQTDDFRRTLAANIGVSDITEDQAAALYWLVIGRAKSDRYTFLAAQLKGLGEQSPFDSSNRPKPGWAPRVGVQSVLQGADPRIKTRLQQIIGAWLTNTATTPGVPSPAIESMMAAPAAAPLPLSAGPPGPRPSSPLPSSIGIRIAPQ